MQVSKLLRSMELLKIKLELLGLLVINKFS